MKLLAYFLPQFYPTPENNIHWGKGFTDWKNVQSSTPLFKEHKQPLMPSKFDMYDLSKKTVLKELSDFSLKKGLDGFGYWHYWFGNGKQTLEKVQEMHLKHSSIKQNFFFAWANQDWTKSWVGDDKTTIFKQLYSKKSALNHFKYILPFIRDSRYIQKNGRPLFQVINPSSDGVKLHIKILEKEALSTIGSGFHWLFPYNRNIEGLENLSYSRVGYSPGDVTVNDMSFSFKRKLQNFNIINGPIIIPEKKYLNAFKKTLKDSFKNEKSYFPCVLSGWDNTPRYKNKGFLIDAEIPSLLEKQFKILINLLKNKDKPEFVFIKSWNEWAEGNVLEPYKLNDKEFIPSDLFIDFKNNYKNI